MARQTREEWLAGLKPGDAISCKFPGDELPSVGKAESVSHPDILGRFPGRDHLIHFRDGALLGAPECLLWMVATGKGGSVGPRIVVSNRGPGLSLGVEVDDGR
jgi:hypothetical protein